MKKNLILLTVVFLTSVFYGCKKDTTPEDDYSCVSCKRSPDALPGNDAISKGVYKGIVIGSTGTIQFNIANGNNTINAVMVLDGTTINLTSNIQWNAGVAIVGNFTGTYNGANISITFSVDANGGNPKVTASNIPGHPNAVFLIAKEQSNFLLECFEGTYNNESGEKGTFNLVVARALGLIGGASRPDGSNEIESIDGSVDADGNLYDENRTKVGKIDGDIISGSFKDHNNHTVTIKARRTL